jgi:hypothetical protein
MIFVKIINNEIGLRRALGDRRPIDTTGAVPDEALFLALGWLPYDLPDLLSGQTLGAVSVTNGRATNLVVG